MTRTRTLRSRRAVRLVMTAAAGLWSWAGCARPEPAAPPERLHTLGPRDLEKLAKTDHIALLNRCLKHYEAHYRDYTCTLIKRERVRGKLLKEDSIRVKFRDKPFSVAMSWPTDPCRADRLLYVEGKYGGNMLVRPTNILFRRLVGTLQRKPDGTDARKNCLRTVNEFGFKRSLLKLLEFYVKGRRNGVLRQAFDGYAKVGGRKTLVLVRYLPDTPDYSSYRTRTYLDLQYLVPIYTVASNKAGDLIYRYLLKDVKFNVGLTGEDFLPEANGLEPPK